MHQPINSSQALAVEIAHSELINMKDSVATRMFGLGVMQLLIGGLCIIFEGIGLGVCMIGSYYCGIDFIGHGFRSGFLFFLTGSFGIAGGTRRNRRKVVAFCVLSILSAVCATLLVSISVPGVVKHAKAKPCQYNSYNCEYSSTARDIGIAMELMMAIMGLLEGIIAIWSSVTCCTIPEALPINPELPPADVVPQPLAVPPNAPADFIEDADKLAIF